MKKLDKIAYGLVAGMLAVPMLAGLVGRIRWIPERVYCIAGTQPEYTIYHYNQPEETTPDYIGCYRVTAYCSCEQCCGKTDGITATGTVACEGRTIAVDPSMIPYGSRVMVGEHEYIAEDCGGAIQGARIDVYFSDHQAALDFGVQYLDVYIYQ